MDSADCFASKHSYLEIEIIYSWKKLKNTKSNKKMKNTVCSRKNTHSIKILVFSDLRLLRYRCFKFQPRGRTSNNLAVVTFLFFMSESCNIHVGKLWTNAIFHVLYTFMVGWCLGVLSSYIRFWPQKRPSMYPLISPIFFWRFI